MILRRRRLPSALEAPFSAFRGVLAEVEPATAGSRTRSSARRDC